MAAEAEAAREARAKIIAAEGEQKASKALADAADVIAQSPCAIQLRRGLISSLYTWYGNYYMRGVRAFFTLFLSNFTSSCLSLTIELYQLVIVITNVYLSPEFFISCANSFFLSNFVPQFQFEFDQLMTWKECRFSKKNNKLIFFRYLQTLNSISSEKNNTVIFPYPLDLVKRFFYGNK